jgi:adenylate cyclase
MASLPLEAARHFLGRAAKAEIRGGFWNMGDSRVPLGKDGRLLVRFYGKEQTFKTDNAISVIRSFLDLQEGKPPRISPETFKDRVVFIGVNMAGMEDIVTAPVSTRFPGTEFLATATANLLGGESLREPGDAVRFLALLGLGLAGGILAFLIWKPLPSAGAALLLLGAWWGIGLGAFGSGLVLDMFFPVLVLGGAFVAEILAAYFAEGRQKKEVSRAFAQYLSPVVIQDLMRKPGALKLGGETREITVSFSDIKGFSSFSEGMTPGELVSFLNVYLTTMTDVILEHRGVVDKYVGDLVMAFWGAPVGLDDGAARACLSVLDQRKAVAKLNEGFKAEGRPAIQFRTGINTGPAVVGNMGSTQRFDYTAMGDTVNLASRLEGANKFFGTYVMMSDATRKAAGEAIVVRRLGRVQVVGKGIPTTVHELLGRQGDLLDRDLERLRMYHEALEVLESGRAGECARILEGLLVEARDPVVELYLKKAREIDETRAPWDGVWVLTSKG